MIKRQTEYNKRHTKTQDANLYYGRLWTVGGNLICAGGNTLPIEREQLGVTWRNHGTGICKHACTIASNESAINLAAPAKNVSKVGCEIPSPKEVNEDAGFWVLQESNTFKKQAN